MSIGNAIGLCKLRYSNIIHVEAKTKGAIYSGSFLAKIVAEVTVVANQVGKKSSKIPNASHVTGLRRLYYSGIYMEYNE